MSTAAHAPAVPPKPPTLAEIQAMMPGLKLYNPSDEWLPLHVHGLTHRWMPPDKDGAIEEHPITGEATVCDGIYEVKGRFLTQKDSSGKVIEGQDAFAVVSYVIHQDRYGEMGVVYLPGQSAEQDQAYRNLAKDKHLKYRAEMDDRLIERRKEFKSNWERNPIHKGIACPPPSEKEQAAIDRAVDRVQRKTYQYECLVPECAVGYASNDWVKFAKHMFVAHAITASRDAKGKVTLVNSEGDRLKMGAGAGATSGVPEPINPEAEYAQPGIAETIVGRRGRKKA